MANTSVRNSILGRWLTEQRIVDFDADADLSGLTNPARVRSLLVAAAREGRAVSYSELLRDLGHRFTRPKMRAVCKTLDAIDEAAAAVGEPALAVLVVRESDGLPGQGWWIGARDARGYRGGRQASAFVAELQQAAFAFWAAR